jgi:hypothetical protein
MTGGFPEKRQARTRHAGAGLLFPIAVPTLYLHGACGHYPHEAQDPTKGEEPHMATDLFTRHCDRRAQMVRDLVQEHEEAWKVAHNEAMRAWDADIMIAETIDLIRLGRDVARRCEDAALNDAVHDLFSAGAGLRNLLGSVLDACHETQAFATDIRDHGFEVSRLDELDIAIADVQRILDEIDATWPQFDSKTYELSLDDLKHGRHRKAKEILDELRRDRDGCGAGEGVAVGPSSRS